MLFKSVLSIAAAYFFLNTATAQNVAPLVQKKLDWVDSKDSRIPLMRNFDLGKARFGKNVLPSITFSVETPTRCSAEFSDFEYREVTGFADYFQSFTAQLSAEFKTGFYHSMGGKTGYTGINICPFKYEGGRVYQLTSFSYRLIPGTPFTAEQNLSKKRFGNTSVLSAGEWFKFSVTQDGMYKIDANWLSTAGINLDGVDPRTIKIHSTQGGMLPEVIKDFRYDDLPENAIQVVGENDGKFDAGDYILFYAQSPHKWVFNSVTGQLEHSMNIYSDKTFFFMTFRGANGKRISDKSDGNSLTADKSFDWFNYTYFHDDEKENICHEGRITLGEKFDGTTSYAFSHNISNIDGSRNTSITFFGVAAAPVNSKMTLNVNNLYSGFLQFYGLPVEETPCYSADTDRNETVTFQTSNPTINLNFTYNKPVSSAKAWLDYYEIQCARKLFFSEGFMPFRNYQSLSSNVSEYRIGGLPSGAVIYDVSDPVNIRVQKTFTDNGENVFRDPVPALSKIPHEFVLSNGSFLSPLSEGRVNNQNLHGTASAQFIIVAPPALMDAANKLADFHKKDMTVLVVTPQAIYNEFSGGSQDLTAIRDFFRMVYYNNTNPATQLKYAMLLGDASYDYKDKVANNTNFVPTYESDPHLINSFDYYCSDDFFGFLDSGDGLWQNEQKLEIAVTRLPAASAEEAMGMVNKIIKYKDNTTLGDWRNAVTFLADDVDDPTWEYVFVDDFEEIFDSLDRNFKNVNVRKVYLDAYKQENLGGSQRYPLVQDAIAKEFEKGTFVFNYMGHGGDEYIASEKVIDIPMINSMKNIHNLPAFFTASCSIGKYDDATHKSGGEYFITNPDGGAIAMFTTVRLVFVGPNAQITKFFWNECLYARVGGKWPTLGDIYKKLKNRPGQDNNDRKFTLFADPALILNYPEHVVKIDSVNNRSTQTGNDTLKALAKVTFKGHIEDITGTPMNNFNGVLFPTIYDKKTTLQTLGNNNANLKESFELYNNILYKGEASISNGKYAFSFVVPKDIAYNYGYGKVSLYGKNENTDATGNSPSTIVGGTASNVAADNTGPEIELFVDDYTFISGGMTDNSPLLLAKIKDENGVNTSGSGIGRDLLITIDKGTINEKSFVANSFYKADLNSYTSGELKYQLEGVADGKHTYTLKVWDVYNNSSEATIDFIVSNGEAFQISHLLNYPNPFSTNTTFHFDHNRAGQSLNVNITIYTISGKIIKNIEQFIPSSNSHVADITWNGRDDYDDKLSKGVYIYKIHIKTDDGQSNEKTEKLVILN